MIVQVPQWAKTPPSTQRTRFTRRRLIVGAITLALLVFIFWLNFPFLPDPQILLFKRPTTNLTSDVLPEQWAMAGGNLAQSRYVESLLQQPKGQVAWSRNLGEPTRSPPLVVDGVVYIGGHFKIMALDADTGRILWERETTGPVHSSLAIAGDTLFFGLLDHRLIAQDLHSGETRWEFKAGDVINASPTVANGIVYIGSDDGVLYALDAANGKLIWQFEAGNPISTQPAIHDGLLFVGDSPGNLYILSARTGQERLRFRTHGPLNASPVAANGLVFFPSGGTLFALDAGTREIPGQFQFKQVWAQFWLWQVPGVPPPPGQQGGKWRFSAGRSQLGTNSSPAVAEDTLYVGDLEGHFYAKNPLLGTSKWQYEVAKGIKASPVILGDQVVFGARDGNLYALDRFSGKIVWQRSLGAPIEVSPVFSGRRLYVRTTDGRLHAVE